MLSTGNKCDFADFANFNNSNSSNNAGVWNNNECSNRVAYSSSDSSISFTYVKASYVSTNIAPNQWNYCYFITYNATNSTSPYWNWHYFWSSILWLQQQRESWIVARIWCLEYQTIPVFLWWWYNFTSEIINLDSGDVSIWKLGRGIVLYQVWVSNLLLVG